MTSDEFIRYIEKIRDLSLVQLKIEQYKIRVLVKKMSSHSEIAMCNELLQVIDDLINIHEGKDVYV